MLRELVGPDPDDLHHVAAAAAGGAATLVTWNLADFPAKVLAPLGITAMDPDAYLCGLLERDAQAVARRHGYLGGKDNFPADRAAAEAVIAGYPPLREAARANRAFLGRAMRYAAAQGIDQFLDIGTGVPGPGNTTDVARTVVPDARVVYVDNDPIVLTHARVLLAGAEGAPS